MKKIMFNDRYGLTQAVIEGRKTMVRQVVKINSSSPVNVRLCAGYIQIVNDEGYTCDEKKLPYKVGEVIAVAQDYCTTIQMEGMQYDKGLVESLRSTAGWRNKMFARADMMPHRIRITGIRVERLQDISDEECMKEGVRVEYAENGRAGYYILDSKRMRELWYDTPQDAFASLIDKICGCVTWDHNPWVVVYEFELVK